jgi:putative oxidoreductase
MTQATSPDSAPHKITLNAAYTNTARLADKLQSPFLLFIRLYIGYQCITSGYAHITNFQTMVKNFNEWHVPTIPHIPGILKDENKHLSPQGFNVFCSAMTEMVGGALLLIGLASRLVAAILTINFTVALFSVELYNYDFSWAKLGAQIWKDQSPILGDTAFPFLATALIILIFGPGWLSADSIVRLLLRRKVPGS